MENDIIEKNVENFEEKIYEQSLKQTELLEKQAKMVKTQTIVISAFMFIVAIAAYPIYI